MYVKSENGFSLMELMVVVMIIGIMSAIAIPGMSGVQARRELNHTARTLASHLNLARSEAVKQNQVVYVAFDSTRYRVQSTKGTEIQSWVKFGDSKISLSFCEDDEENPFGSITINDGEDSHSYTVVGFNGRGLAEAAGDLTIEHAELGESRIISVSLGGSVKIND